MSKLVVEQQVCQAVLSPVDKFSSMVRMPQEKLSVWLRRKLASRGLSQTDLALEIDQNPSVISRWIRGLQKPSLMNARRLADFFGVPREEVLAMVFGTDPDEAPPLAQPRSFREQALEFLAGMPVAVPVVDQLASAGPGQQVMDYVYLEPGYETDGRYIAIRVKGRSMEPELHDGDTVILDTEATPDVGELVVATVGDDVYVKELRRKGEHLVLVGRDKREIPADDAKIEGVAIQTIRALRRR